MKEYSKDTIRNLISFLITENYIKTTQDKYPILSLTSNANDVLFKGKTVSIKKKIEKAEEEMLKINGVGNAKLKKYGHEFLKAIQKYTLSNKKSILPIL